jgi:hypothetical protein
MDAALGLPASSNHVCKGLTMQIDVEASQGDVVDLSAARLKTIFADERRQTTTQRQEL